MQQLIKMNQAKYVALVFPGALKNEARNSMMFPSVR